MDFDSDDSLPGRFEESSNSEYFDTKSASPRPKNRTSIAIAIVFVVISSGFFAYYFMNQNDIDSQIIQNTFNVDPERKMMNQYDIGEYGSDHAHAAIAVFVNDEQINFGLPQFQLSSKYIHFENHNPYLIHKHATGVPLEVLFASIGIKITHDCITLNYDRSEDNNKTNRFCAEQDQSMIFYVNGEKYPNISQYVLEHNDRILVSLGDAESISNIWHIWNLWKSLMFQKRLHSILETMFLSDSNQSSAVRKSQNISKI